MGTKIPQKKLIPSPRILLKIVNAFAEPASMLIISVIATETSRNTKVFAVYNIPSLLKNVPGYSMAEQMINMAKQNRLNMPVAAASHNVYREGGILEHMVLASVSLL